MSDRSDHVMPYRWCCAASRFTCVVVGDGSVAVLFTSLFFFSSRRRHTRFKCDWSSDVCSSDLAGHARTRHRTISQTGARIPRRQNSQRRRRRKPAKRVGSAEDPANSRRLKLKTVRFDSVHLDFWPPSSETHARLHALNSAVFCEGPRMRKWKNKKWRMLVAGFTLALQSAINVSAAQSGTTAGKTRLAVVGLDHDHVWSLLKDIAGEPSAALVAIAESDPTLVSRAQKGVPASVKFYSDYVKMLDEAKPDAVIVTTSNDRHLEILRQCAKRHIHYSTEKPLAANAADAREMEPLAREANIKLMVNYWNAWVPSSHDIFRRVRAGEVGPIQRIIVQYGHRGPKEIGVSQQFANWLYDPVKNGGGAIMDFGCYGAELSVWLKGRPTRVYATTRKLKVEQNNKVDDDASFDIVYPDASSVITLSSAMSNGKVL